MSALTLNKYQIIFWPLPGGFITDGASRGFCAAPERLLPLPSACSFLAEHCSDCRSH